MTTEAANITYLPIMQLVKKYDKNSCILVPNGMSLVRHPSAGKIFVRIDLSCSDQYSFKKVLYPHHDADHH